MRQADMCRPTVLSQRGLFRVSNRSCGWHAASVAWLLLASWVAPVAGQWAGVQLGLGLPLHDFASPPREEPVAQGAQPGYWIEAFYLHPLGPAYLRSGASFASFGEKERAFTSVGSVAGFHHDVLSFVLGVELDCLGQRSVQPFVHGGGGLYAYCGRATDVGRTAQGENIAGNEFRFKWRVRLGLEVEGGLAFEVVPELVQLRLALAYTVVFTGTFNGFVGYEAGSPLFEYPYPYRGDRIDYLRLGLGVAVHPQ